MDEIIKGTNPIESRMIIRGMIRYLFENKKWLLLSTHSVVFENKSAEHVSYFMMAGFKKDEQEILEQFQFDTCHNIIGKISEFIDYQPVKTEIMEIPKKAKTICRILNIDPSLFNYINNEYIKSKK